MAYCTREDVEARIAAEDITALTDDIRAEQTDDGKLTLAIEDADSLINTFLNKRYVVPFATTPKLIRKLSIELTIYNLAYRKYTIEMPDGFRFRYTDSISLLKQIAKGDIDLDDVPSTDTEFPDIIKTNKCASDRVFGKDVMAQW